MGDLFYEKISNRTTTSAAGTNAGVSATVTAVAGYKLTCLGIDASGDAAALVTIESPSGTVLWRKRFAAAFTLGQQFEVGEIVGASGQALVLKISASTSNCEANIEAAQMQG